MRLQACTDLERALYSFSNICAPYEWDVVGAAPYGAYNKTPEKQTELGWSSRVHTALRREHSTYKREREHICMPSCISSFSPKSSGEY